MSRPWLRLVAVVLASAAAIALLHLAGSGDLAAPPLRSWTGFEAWLRERDGVTAAFAIVRLVALGAAWYVAVTIAIGCIGRLTDAGRLVLVADAATLPAVRRLLATLAVAPAVAGAFTYHGGSPSPDSPRAATADRLVLVAGPAGDDQLVLLPNDEGTATMHRVDDVPSTWTVQPGDHLWGIAEETLAGRLGRTPTDAEIDPYWRALVERNRDRLATGDADLIFPGQVFDLP